MSEQFDTAGPPIAEAQAILTIDLGALADNWRLLRDRAAPAECAAVIKADGYGIGVEPAAKALAAAGCRTFFVAHVSEGVRVRAALGDANGYFIYALNGMLPGDAAARAVIGSAIKPVIASREALQEWLRSLAIGLGAMPAALQFNSGMNRLGIDCAEAADVCAMLRQANAYEHIDLVMSHFVSSEIADDPLNARQIAAFETVRAIFPDRRASMANSSGIFLPQKPHYDLVRPGYALYGGNPLPDQANPMQSVVRLQAPILQLREIEAGETAGYNARWTASRRSLLAILGLGYADGILRSATGLAGREGAQGLVAGVRCPFVGRISMDLSILDVTDAPRGGVAPGVMAEVLGPEIGVDEFGERSGTIGYEILTSLGPRYHRIYRA